MKNSLNTLKNTIEQMCGDTLLLPFFEKAVAMIVLAISQGGKVLVAGNGGSAAEAQHFVAELVGRYLKERRALPALALTTDTSILTALGNDYSFDVVFSRQVEALGNKGDVLVVLTTSGNSHDLIRAAESARQKGMTTIALLGNEGGALRGVCDLEFIVPSKETPRIQEMHLFIIHALSEAIENACV